MSAEARYKVILTKEYLPGFEPQAVQLALCQILTWPQPHIAMLMRGPPAEVGKDLSEDEALELTQRLKAAGAVAVMQEQPLRFKKTEPEKQAETVAAAVKPRAQYEYSRPGELITRAPDGRGGWMSTLLKWGAVAGLIFWAVNSGHFSDLQRREHHLLYEPRISRFCGPALFSGSSITTQFGMRLLETYARRVGEPIEKFMQRNPHLQCYVNIEVVIGNVGKAPLESVSFEFDYRKLEPYFPVDKPRQFLDVRFDDASTSRKRRHDPKVKRSRTGITLSDIDRNTIIRLQFVGWSDEQIALIQPENMLKSVAIKPHGEIGLGNPQTNSLLRFLFD